MRFGNARGMICASLVLLSERCVSRCVVLACVAWLGQLGPWLFFHIAARWHDVGWDWNRELQTGGGRKLVRITSYTHHCHERVTDTHTGSHSDIASASKQYTPTNKRMHCALLGT